MRLTTQAVELSEHPMASPLNFATGLVRTVLGTAERDVVKQTPLHQAIELEDKLDGAVVAIHRAADSMERHVVVVETLASSVPALTESVNALVAELNSLLKVIAPVAEVEEEVGKLRHMFGRHRPDRDPAGGAGVLP